MRQQTDRTPRALLLGTENGKAALDNSLAAPRCETQCCWRRLLRVPWTAKRSNQSILKEINPKYSSEGLMLKPKPQYFGHLMQRADSLEKTWCWERLKEGEEGDRGPDGWMASSIQSMWTWAKSRRWWGTGKPGVLQSMGWQRVGHDLATTQQKWMTQQFHYQVQTPQSENICLYEKLYTALFTVAKR